MSKKIFGIDRLTYAMIASLVLTFLVIMEPSPQEKGSYFGAVIVVWLLIWLNDVYDKIESLVDEVQPPAIGTIGLVMTALGFRVLLGVSYTETYWLFVPASWWKLPITVFGIFYLLIGGLYLLAKTAERLLSENPVIDGGES